MSRDLDAGLETAIEASVVRPFLAIRIDVPDAVYVFTGTGQMIFADADGVTRTWIGAGGIGSIDTIGEASDGTATGIKIVLFAVPAEFRDNIADQAVPGVKMDIGLGAFDETYQRLEGITWISRYKLDQYKITDNGTSLSVEITGESRAIDQKRPAIKRFTNEYQQRMHPGDLFFQYVAQLTEVSILWAAAEQSAASVVPVASSGGGGRRGTLISPLE